MYNDNIFIHYLTNNVHEHVALKHKVLGGRAVYSQGAKHFIDFYK